MRKLLVVLVILFTAFPIFAETEIVSLRGKDSKVFDIGGGQNRLDIGSDISHYKDDAGNYQDVDFETSDTSISAGYTKSYKKNNVRIEIKEDVGRFRVYPKRNRDDIYVEIGSVSGVSVSSEIIRNAKGRAVAVSVFKDTPNVTYRFLISDKGFKPLYILKNQTGVNTFQEDIYFELVGLTRSGRNIQLNGNTITTLGNAFWYDSNRESGNISESINGNIVTLDRTDIPAGLTFPVYIDPTLDIQPTTTDALIKSDDATTNFGALDYINVRHTTVRNSIGKFDFSALPDTATISSVTADFYYEWTGVPALTGSTVNLDRLLRTDFVEGEATWNIYKTGSSWTTAGAGSDGNDFTSTDRVTAVVPSSYGWMQWTPTAQVQWAQANSAEIYYFKLSTATGAVASAQADFISKDEVTDTTLRPKLSIIYTGEDPDPDNWYYIDPVSGNDGNDGQLTSTPWQTFSYAQTQLSPGDILFLMDGTYTETLTISISGTAGNPITFKAQNDGGAILDGTDDSAVIYASGKNYITLEGIICKNSNGTVINLQTCTNFILKRMSSSDALVSGNNDQYLLSNCTNCLLEDCIAYGTGRSVFTVFKSDGCTLRRCWSYYEDSPLGGVSIQIYNSTNSIVENCVATQKAGSKAIWGITNWLHQPGAFVGDNNKFYGNVVYNISGTTGGFHNGSSEDNVTGTIFKDNVSINNGTAGFRHAVDSGLIANNFTIVGSSGSYLYYCYSWKDFYTLDAGFQIGGGVKNSSFFSNSLGLYYNSADTGFTSFANTYNNYSSVTTKYSGNASAGTGETETAPVYDTTTFGKGAYLFVPTALKGQGESGVDIGAEVLYRYVDGVKTSSPLWPFPMESRIFAETGVSATWEADGGIWKTLTGVYVEPVPVTLANPTGVTTSQFDIAWSQNLDSDFDYYEVHYGTSSGFTISESTQFGADITNQATVTATITGLSDATTYYVKVRVVDTDTFFSDSNERSATTGGGDPPGDRNASWPFEDGSGITVTETLNGYDATIVGSGYTWVTGKIGTGAIELLGTDSYVEVGDSSDAFDVGTDTGFAVSFWFKPKAWTSNASGSVIGKYDGSSGLGGYWIRFLKWDANEEKDDLRFFARGNTNAAAAGAGVTATNLTLDTWYHAVMNIEATASAGTLTAYLDNNLVGQNISLSGSVMNSKDFEIGNNGSSSSDTLQNIIIDEVKVFDHALSLSEIGDLFNAGSGQGNQPPTAVSDTASTTGVMPVTFDILSNDTDSDGSVDWTTFEIQTSLSNGSIVYPDIDTQGTVTYTANVDFSGNDTFSYTVKDNLGSPSNHGLVTVTVNQWAPEFVPSTPAISESSWKSNWVSKWNGEYNGGWSGSMDVSGEQWEYIYLRTQAQLDAGHFGGGGLQQIRCISQSPSNPSIVWMGIDTSGTWKSTDQGKTWKSKRYGFRSKGVVAIEVHPTNKDIVFASGTVHKEFEDDEDSAIVDGIYRTTNGGNDWKLVRQCDFYGGWEGDHYAFDPDDPDIVYAATHSEGILKSTDGGDTWDNAGTSTGRIVDIELHKIGTDTTVYFVDSHHTGASNGLLKFVNDGAATELGDVPSEVKGLAIRRGTSFALDKLYAIVDSFSGNELYKSTNGGSSFTGISISGTDKLMRRIAISPANANYLWAKNTNASTGPWFSTDSGETWDLPTDKDVGDLALTSPLGEKNSVGYPIEPHPNNKSKLLTGINSAVFKSVDNGQNFSYSNDKYEGGKRSSSTSAAWFSPTDRNYILFAIHDHGILETTDGGITWRLIEVPSTNGKRNCESVVRHPVDTNRIIATVGSTAAKEIIVSEDAGESWTNQTTTDSNYVYLAIDPIDPDYVFAGGKDGSWVSSSAGQDGTWSALSPQKIIWTASKTESMIYATDLAISELWRSDDKTATWTKVSDLPVEIVQLKTMDVDSVNSNKLYVADRDGVWRWSYGGDVWKEIGLTGGIPLDVVGGGHFAGYVVVNNPLDRNEVFVGRRDLTANGGVVAQPIWISNDLGTTFTDALYNLSGFFAVLGAAYNPYNGDLWISTHVGNFVLRH